MLVNSGLYFQRGKLSVFNKITVNQKHLEEVKKHYREEVKKHYIFCYNQKFAFYTVCVKSKQTFSLKTCFKLVLLYKISK